MLHRRLSSRATPDHPPTRTTLARVVLAVWFVVTTSVAGPSLAAAAPPPVLDGVVLRHLPDDLGPLVTDFTSTYDDVDQVSRVWERGSDATGYSEDLAVAVLRGDALADAGALRAWMTTYLERDPATWALRPFHHPDGPGFTDGQRVFWLVEPGMAVSVRVDAERFTAAELRSTARGVRAVG